MTDYYMAVADQKPDLKMTLSDQDGPVNLSGASSVTLQYRLGDTAKSVVGTIEPLQSTTGKGFVFFTFAQASDIPAAGRWRVQVEVMWPGAQKQTFPSKDHDWMIVTERVFVA
jgi:hypothetical protein